MKYGSIKHKDLKTLRVSSLDGGVVLNEMPSAIADNALSEGSNMWHSGGRLKTRPGLFALAEYACELPLPDDSGDYDYYAYTTGTFVTVGGEKKQIVVSDIYISDSHLFRNIYFVGEDKRMVPAGGTVFARTSSDVFYKPFNMTFYEGKPQSGGGIFMLLAVKDQYHPTDRYFKIYEINSELSDWVQVQSFYIPTLYINGRGNKYALAKAENQISYDSPITLESPNMLNGRFHAYYTSDGYSYSFRLPFTDLAYETIVCRIYYTLVDYVEWTIGATTIMDTQSFFGTEVSMIADREKGTVYFRTDGSDYAIPIMDMYHENNIKITATKEIEDGFERIVTSSCVATSESRILLSGGEYGNEVYSASYRNPLYFPQGSSTVVGEDNRKVTGLAVQENKILAFKEDETHLLVLNKGEPYNSTSLLADNDSVFCKADSFTSACISAAVGCPNFKAFAFCGKNAVWLGGDGVVYAMPSFTSKTLYAVSGNVQSLLSDQVGQHLSSAFAIYGNGYYVLNLGQKAFIMECGKSGIRSYSNIQSLRWFLWDFPSEITLADGFSLNSECYFVCLGTGRKICYISTLSGEKDTDMYYLDDAAVSEELTINSSLTTKTFNFSKPAVPKNIEAVYITLAAKGKVSIGLNGKTFTDIDFGFSDEDYNKGVYKSVKLLRNLHGVESVYITLESSSDLSVGELEISYTY